VGTATHYHTLAVNPIWNRSLTRVAIVGAHIFFRWAGTAGTPQAFYANYTGREPNPGPRPHPIKPFVPLAPATVIAGGTALPAPAAGPDASYTALEATLAKQRAAIEAQAQARAMEQAARQTDYSARALAPTRPVKADNRYVSGALPESDIRPEFQGSGEWIKRP
jgi:hypothetical protein